MKCDFRCSYVSRQRYVVTWIFQYHAFKKEKGNLKNSSLFATFSIHTAKITIIIIETTLTHAHRSIYRSVCTCIYSTRPPDQIRPTVNLSFLKASTFYLYCTPGIVSARPMDIINAKLDVPTMMSRSGHPIVCCRMVTWHYPSQPNLALYFSVTTLQAL